MNIIEIQTQKKKQVIDITDIVNSKLPKGTGVAHLFVLHTSVALTTAELGPGTDLDMLDAFEAIVPKLPYRHPHDPSHVGDHILSTMIGTSLCVPFEDGVCVLGTWQRVVLIEFNSPRKRSIAFTIIN